MTFQAVLPFGGYTGWKFLGRTKEVQQATFNKTVQVQRETEYFKTKIASIPSAEALVNDRQLLKVALGAFGLDDDLRNKFFLKKVLEEGTAASGALANRLSDKRYFEFAQAFGFGEPAGPNIGKTGFAQTIVDAYKTKQFEVAVGNKNSDMRLALSIQRDLPILADRAASDTTKWFTILGSAPMRKVFEKAFGLPPSFASVNIDTQLSTMRQRADTLFGDTTVSQFSDPENIEKLVRLFLVRSDQQAGSFTSANGVGLQLLQSRRSF